jgi:hypothetical protein
MRRSATSFSARGSIKRGRGAGGDEEREMQPVTASRGYFFFEDLEALERPEAVFAEDFFVEDFVADDFFVADAFLGVARFTSPLSPCPGFTVVVALLRRSAASDLPTSTTSLNFPSLSRRTNRLSPGVGSINLRFLAAFLAAMNLPPPPGFARDVPEVKQIGVAYERGSSGIRDLEWAESASA